MDPVIVKEVVGWLARQRKEEVRLKKLAGIEHARRSRWIKLNKAQRRKATEAARKALILKMRLTANSETDKVNQ